MLNASICLPELETPAAHDVVKGPRREPNDLDLVPMVC